MRNIYHIFSKLKILLSIHVRSLYWNTSFTLKIHMIDYNAFCTTHIKCLFCLVVWKVFWLLFSLLFSNRVQEKFEVVFMKGFQPLTTRLLQSIIYRMFFICIYLGVASICVKWGQPFGWLARGLFRDYIKKKSVSQKFIA